MPALSQAPPDQQSEVTARWQQPASPQAVNATQSEDPLVGCHANQRSTELASTSSQTDDAAMNSKVAMQSPRMISLAERSSLRCCSLVCFAMVALQCSSLLEWGVRSRPLKATSAVRAWVSPRQAPALPEFVEGLAEGRLIASGARARRACNDRRTVCHPQVKHNTSVLSISAAC